MLKRLLFVLVPIALAAVWLLARGTPPPEVPAVQARRETLVSTLTTNGKVDPISWAAIHAEVAGPVLQVPAERGKAVHKGEVILTIGSADAQSELSTAQTRVNAAQAEVDRLRGGGRASDRVEVESGLLRARADLETAQREANTLQRLFDKKAATRAELDGAQETLRITRQQVQAFELRGKSLVTAPDVQSAEARLAEAKAGVALAGRRISESLVRSPMDGILYDLQVRPGAYVTPGTPLARVGRLDQLRVNVYVDEPELGRVAKDMPVRITWTALPGREWKGKVESVPLEIVAVGTRQVGEVVCLIDNPDLSLIAGTNVDAEIQSRVVPGALTIPKEALRREGSDTGVFTIRDGKLVWQKVRTGVSSVTRVQILEGVNPEDQIALPIDTPLKAGDKVKPQPAS